MKLNWKIIFLNGIKGGLLLISCAAVILLFDKVLDNINGGLVIELMFSPVVAIIFIIILLKVIPNFKGYTFDPDWDLEPGLSTILSMIIFMTAILIYQ